MKTENQPTVIEVLRELKKIYTMNRTKRFLSFIQTYWFVSIFGFNENYPTRHGMCRALTHIIPYPDSKLRSKVLRRLEKEYRIQFNIFPKSYYFEQGLVTPRLKLINQAIKRIEKKTEETKAVLRLLEIIKDSYRPTFWEKLTGKKRSEKLKYKTHTNSGLCFAVKINTDVEALRYLTMSILRITYVKKYSTHRDNDVYWFSSGELKPRYELLCETFKMMEDIDDVREYISTNV